MLDPLSQPVELPLWLVLALTGYRAEYPRRMAGAAQNRFWGRSREAVGRAGESSDERRRL